MQTSKPTSIKYPTTLQSLVALAVLMPFSAAGNDLRTVAISNQRAPGTSSGNVFGSFRQPVLNNLGQTAFSAGLAIGLGDAGNFNSSGIWSESNGSLSLVARDGFQAPDAPAGHVFYGLSDESSSTFGRTPLLLNDSGQLVFRAATGSNWQGIWSYQNGELHLVARQGSTLTGSLVGNTLFTIERPALSGSGDITFTGLLTLGVGDTTNENDEGIWIVRNGTLSLAYRKGQQAPDTPSGVVFNDFADPAINGSGQIDFLAYLQGEQFGVTIENRMGVWAAKSNSLTLVARAGLQQPPGTPSGTRFERFSSIRVNSSGNAAFSSTIMPYLVGPSYPFQNHGIWVEANGGQRLVARQGGQPPGVAAGAKFSWLPSHVLNDQGQVAFLGSMLNDGSGGVTFVNSDGIWSEGFGSLTLIARTGSPAPGLAMTNPLQRILTLAFNNAGQVAFYGTDSSRNNGLWAQDRAGVLRLIALNGQQIDVDDGPGFDLRTIADVQFVGGAGIGSGRGSGFNDLGQIAFFARFTDGTSGVFVSNAAMVPEVPPIVLIVGALSIFFSTMGRSKQRKSVK